MLPVTFQRPVSIATTCWVILYISAIPLLRDPECPGGWVWAGSVPRPQTWYSASPSECDKKMHVTCVAGA